MIWWQWMVLGALLLSAEVVVDAEFYLVFFGISAMCVGLLGISPIALPVWGQWVLFSIMSVVNLGVFRSRIYARVRGRIVDRAEGVDGEVAIVDDEILANEFGSARLRGTVWKAHNVGSVTLAPGSRAIVASADGLVIAIRADR